MTRQSKSEIIIRIIGIALALGGIALAIIGISELASGKIGTSGNLFWLALIGFPMLGVGLMITMLSFRRIIMERGLKKRNELIEAVSQSEKNTK